MTRPDIVVLPGGVTTNTIAHASNGIDVTGLLATALGDLLGRAGQGAQQGERP